MATGSAISEVFCAAATMTLPRAPFSQYSRPDEAAVLVSQYNVMLSSTSSFVGDCAGSAPNFQSLKPGCTSIQAARPAGESVAPYPTVCGRAVIIVKYVRLPFFPDAISASTCARSLSDSPVGA